MARSLVCGACGVDVPPGRLACPACGEILASVGAPGAGPRTATAATARPDQDLGLPYWDDESADDGWTADDPVPVADAPVSPLSAVAPSAVAPVAPVAVAAEPAARWPMPAELAPARAWGGAAMASPADEGRSGAATAEPPDGTAAGPAAPASDDSAAGILGSGRTADELVGWLAIAGSGLAMIGFVLPWSVSVIGARGVEYFDRWGFAGPGHLLIVLGLAAVIVSAILRDRVRAPTWLAVGLPALGLGALLIGLIWPYLIGPLGAQSGVMAVTVGALLLIAAGIGAAVLDRHGPARPGV
jgi:hypothetical protein